MIPDLAGLSRDLPIDLHVVTNPVDGAVANRLTAFTAGHGPALAARFTPWSLAATWQAIADADLVVVPSLTGQRKAVKSANRLVDSIRLGRFVIAYPLPSYTALGSYVWLGESMAAGIRWAVANPEVVHCRLHAGQKYVTTRFAPDVVARQWLTMLRRVSEAAPAIATPAIQPLPAAPRTL